MRDTWARRILTVTFHTKEGLYTRNGCVYRQFWHFSLMISLIINLNFYKIPVEKVDFKIL